MRFALRDDDTNFFTEPAIVERAYARIWDRCPVSLAVVPFHGCAKTGAIPNEHWSGSGHFALHHNQALVAWLKEAVSAGRVSILLHGFDHVDLGGKPEFASGLGSEDLAGRLRLGKEYLAGVIGQEPAVFVPPHNAMSRAALTAIDEVGLDLMGTFSFRPGHRRLSPHHLAPMLRRQVFLMLAGRSGWRGGFYPRVLTVGRHREIACHNLNLDPICTLDHLLMSLEQTRRVNGDFCLAAHHWEMGDPRLSEWLDRIVDEAAAMGARFVHARDLFDRGGARRRVRRGWMKAAS